MPPLPNPRQEQFALGLAEGKTQSQAYADAGYSPNRGNAVRMKTYESVQARVAELQRTAADGAIASRKRTLEHLAAIAYAEFGDEDISTKEKLSALQALAKFEGYNVESPVSGMLDERNLSSQDIWDSIAERLNLVRADDGSWVLGGGQGEGGEEPS
jgi:phage terminase small subunit